MNPSMTLAGHRAFQAEAPAHAGAGERLLSEAVPFQQFRLDTHLSMPAAHFTPLRR